MKTAFLASACLLSLLTLPAHAADQVSLSKSDGMLVDAKGMTVYIYDKDSDGKSACTGRCAENWPPVLAGSGTPRAPYSTVTREDGSKQLTYKGKPLYTFVKDKKPGDKEGDRAMNVWHVVRD